MTNMLEGIPDEQKVECLMSLVDDISNEYAFVYTNICDTVLTEDYVMQEEDASPKEAIGWIASHRPEAPRGKRVCPFCNKVLEVHELTIGIPNTEYTMFVGKDEAYFVCKHCASVVEDIKSYGEHILKRVIRSKLDRAFEGILDK